MLCKQGRLADGLSPLFVPEHGWDIGFDLALSRAEAHALVMMGPSAHHVEYVDLQERLHKIPEPVKVRASVRVQTFRNARADPPKRQIGHCAGREG